jgi:hypothetical protein
MHTPRVRILAANVLIVFTGFKIVLVILDGYAAAIDGDENTVSSVRDFFNCFLLPIIANNHVALIVTHHPRCDSGSTGCSDMSLGRKKSSEVTAEVAAKSLESMRGKLHCCALVVALLSTAAWCHMTCTQARGIYLQWPDASCQSGKCTEDSPRWPLSRSRQQSRRCQSRFAAVAVCLNTTLAAGLGVASIGCGPGCRLGCCCRWHCCPMS